MMNKSVLLDTCFLINLFDVTKPYHREANSFYLHFLEKKFPLFLSSIVISEFCIKQKLTEIPYHNFIPLNFDTLDGEIAASIDFHTFKSINPLKTREAVKDDIKLLAQTVNNNIDLLVTVDKSFFNTIIRLKEDNQVSTSAIYIPLGIENYFPPHRQKPLPLFDQY